MLSVHKLLGAHGSTFVEAVSTVSIPRELFAFRPAPNTTLVFGIVWTLAGGRPGSIKIGSTAIAGVLNCDPRAVRRAVEDLAVLGLVDRLDHDGILLTLRVNDPAQIAVARRLIADPQRPLFDVEAVEGGRTNPPPNCPPLMKHELRNTNSCNMRTPDKSATDPQPLAGSFVEAAAAAVARTETRPASIPLGDVEGLALELSRRVGDRGAPMGLFRDVAAAVVGGVVVFDRLKGLLYDLDRGTQEGRIRSRGAVFRVEAAKLFGPSGPPWSKPR